jgi:hypothetical protein
MTMTNRLTLFGEVIAVYCENHAEHVNTVYVDRMQSFECLHTSSDATHWNFTCLTGFSPIKCHF